MEHIGHAAWRVLGKARKAAIARQKEIKDAVERDPAVLGLRDSPITQQHAASQTAGDHAEFGRARRKARRPAE